MSVCAALAFPNRDSDREKERKDASASLHSVHFRCAVVQGDFSEQGEPDRNNTINQTRLSFKSIFLCVADSLPRGECLTSRTDDREWLTLV